jgi:hypothetical protein
MFYYLVESFFVALFINTAWRYILQSQFSVQLSYLHWVFIIWIVKVILFDPIKLAAAVNTQVVLKNKEEAQTEES